MMKNKLLIILGSTFLLSNINNANAENITITDRNQYQGGRIEASLYDDKLINNIVTIDLKPDQVINNFTCYAAKSDKNDNNYNLHGNYIYIKNGGFTQSSIYGGYSDYRFVDKNKIQIDNGLFVGSSGAGINGGYSKFGTVYGNEVKINNGNFGDVNSSAPNINGGYSEYGSISKNKVEINGGIFNNYVDVYGGNSKDIGIVSDNQVIINKVNEKENSNIFGGIYGGHSSAGLVARNIVEINCDIYAFDVFGGSGDEKDLADLYGNKVIIKNSESTIWSIAGAKNNRGAVYNNSVSLTNSEIYGAIYGGFTKNGNVYGNIVSIDNSTFAGNITGGYTEDSDKLVKVDNNLVILKNNSQVEGNVIGGLAKGTNTSCNNTIEVIGSDIDGNIIGGYSEAGKAEGNTIVLKGNIKEYYNFSNSNIIGGYSGSNHLSNNRLILDSWKGEVRSLSGCDEIIFGNINWEKDGTVLKINNERTDLSKTKINGQWINFGFTDITEHINETMQLISNEHGIVFNDYYKDGEQVKFQDGLTHNIYGILKNNQEKNSIDFTIKGRKQNEQLKLMTYNRNIGMAIVKQGNDLLDDTLIGMERTTGIKTFAGVQGNYSRYDIGGNSDINGWSSVVGIARNIDTDNGIFTYGIFYENGLGNYYALNSFNNKSFRFDGSGIYNGGGIALKNYFDDGFYAKVFLRTGNLKNELKRGLYDAGGNNYSYKADSSYYGVKAAIGKLINLNKNSKLDIYCSYDYTHFNSTDFSISGKQFSNYFEFGEVNSQSVRVGGRINKALDNVIDLYYGVAYDYEFDGSTNISTKGELIDDDGGLKGGTIIGELGLKYKNEVDKNWDVDLKLRGYGGNRKGFSINIMGNYYF